MSDKPKMLMWYLWHVFLLPFWKQVFGDKFDIFARNFERSFGSTLRTLRLINEASNNKDAYNLSHLNIENWDSDLDLNNRVGCTSNSGYHSENEVPSVSVQNQMHVAEEVEESVPCLNQELNLNAQLIQRVCVPSSLGSVIINQSIIKKSVMEQARSNDLKTMEIGLTMKKLKLKEAQLALSFDSNHLERSKLAMGISKASFKAEKFKNQVEDTKHAELLRNCLDCLVAGLFIMSISLLYGAYAFSYQRITDATASCNPSVEVMDLLCSFNWFSSICMITIRIGLRIWILCAITLVLFSLEL